MEIPVFRKTFRLGLLLPAAVTLVWGAVFCACTDETDTTHPSPDRTAILNLRMEGEVLPASHAGTTRAPMTRAGLEDDIKTVDVLVFKPDASAPTDRMRGTFFYRTRGRYETSGGQSYVRVELVSSAEKQTLVVLANARKQMDALDAFYGEQRELVMRRLKFSADGTTDKIEINAADGMPMWGELTAQTVDENYARTQATAPVVALERMMAKVTFEMGVEKTQACHYYHGYEAGRIAPNNTTGKPTVDPWDISTRPYIDYSPAAPTSGDQSFYLFESDNRAKAASSKLSNSFFTIRVSTFQNHDFWYRVDLMNYNTEEFYDILRNRHYVIEMTNGGTIRTPGYATEEEAISGSCRFQCRIVPWEQVNENFEMEGSKRLTVDKRSIYLKDASATTTGETLTVTTENTGGWTITDVPLWLTVSPTSSTSDGISNITIKSNGTDVINNGRFKLKAGNAEMDIRVKLGKLPLEYVAEYNLAGGSQYGSPFNVSNPAGATPTAAQTDPDLRWATNHNNNQSGYYTYYVLKGVTEGRYNPSGKNLFSDSFFTTGEGKGYHLPSSQELTSVFPYRGATYGYSTYSNANEACEFGGIKKTFGADYTSTGNGVCYALRFKKGTGNPNDGSPISGSGPNVFPLADDNSMLCAYRYTCVGSFANDNNLDSQLKVDCVYLGEGGASTAITTISNDSWWNDRATEIVTRIFPAAGGIVLDLNWGLFARGANGYYWSGTEAKYDGSSYSHSRAVAFNSSDTGVGDFDNFFGFPVRLFADE